MGKFYAIKEGFDFVNNKKVTDKIVTDWNDCRKYVTGVKSARYKSFTSKEEAQAYLEAGSKVSKEGEIKFDPNILHAYTDGSYNDKTGIASYGVVYVRNNIIEALDYGTITKTEGLNQVIGELKAAIKAAKLASVNKLDVAIHYDYEGVASHATGLFKANSEIASSYNAKMQEYMKSGINVNFVKVDAHTGTLYNELADELCKNELGIPSNNAVNKALQSANSKLTVSTPAVSGILKSIGVYSDYITIVGKNNTNNSDNKTDIEADEEASLPIEPKEHCEDNATNSCNNDRLDVIEQILAKIPKASTDILKAINQLLVQ